MKRLLSIELQKLWKNKSSRILILSYFILLSLIATIATLKFKIGGAEYRIADQGIFNFPYIWHFNTYLAAILKLFLAVIIVSMMANEYTYGTLKQNLIDGLSKKEFIASKFLTVLFFALSSTVFIMILSLILGLSFSAYTEAAIIFTDIDYLLAYFVKLTGFFSFCLFLGILVKRSAFALGFLVLWNFIEGIIFGIFRFGFSVEEKFGESLMRFFPLESMSQLILNPIMRMSIIKTTANQVGLGSENDYSVNYVQILIVLTWTILFILGSYKILKVRDL